MARVVLVGLALVEEGLGLEPQPPLQPGPPPGTGPGGPQLGTAADCRPAAADCRPAAAGGAGPPPPVGPGATGCGPGLLSFLLLQS